MFDLTRRICATFTALAVLIVSATCSAAGCMLIAPATAAQHASVAHSCCQNSTTPDRSGQSPHEGQGRCPLCQNSILINKAIEKSSPDLNPHLVTNLFTAMYVLPHGTSVAAGIIYSANDRPSFAESPTLLNLHCALLA
jgi:hypothetical protein